MKLIRDIGIDLGTANVLCYVEGRGIVLREPSVVAVDKNTGKVLQVGAAARNMLGRTPGNIVAVRPLRDGVISDYEINKFTLVKPRVVVSVPSGITEVEERAVIQAAMEAGARRVYLIEEPFAAALGAKLAISGPEGHMVVDIGGGTTDIAVLSLNGIATSSSIKVAGDTFDEAVAAYMRKHYGMLIGLNTAEEVKITIGCVYPRPQELSMLVKGRDAKTGLPNEVTISSTEMLDAFKRPARQIVDEVLAVLEHSSPELVADIAQTGIVLTGGGSLLYGFDKLISERTEIACSIADDADSCVANGCGRSLQWISSMQEGTINLARIVPCVRQAEQHGEKSFSFQAETLIPQVVIAHRCVIAVFLNPEYRHGAHHPFSQAPLSSSDICADDPRCPPGDGIYRYPASCVQTPEGVPL